jgi:hypothetical protein
MTGKAGLKAGLIGAAVILVVTLLSQIPFVGCVCCALTWLIYAAIGALAGFFSDPPRTAGSGAGAGAIAGLISGVAGGLIWVIVMVIQAAVAGPGNIPAIDPETMRQLTELGVDPEMFQVLTGGMCCLGSLATGAGLGAVGGLIFAALRPE